VKAVVLVGGEGTRLRPLTGTIPKPLLPVVDRPLLQHLLDHLARQDIHEVVLSSPYLGSTLRSFIEDLSGWAGGRRRVRWITEPSPLGTGGAVANAVHRAGLDETFFVLNGDTLTDLDLIALRELHLDRRAVVTIALTEADDAREFGSVELDDGGRVLAFREKSNLLGAGVVSAGAYVFEPAAVQGVPFDRPSSIERGLFPALIASGAPLFGALTDAYWMDVGTRERYLQATFDLLDGRMAPFSCRAPFVASGASVSPRARLGRHVVVSEGCTVAEGANVDRSALLAGSVVEADAHVVRSIVGPGARVGRGASVQDAVLAASARVPAAPG
jgi:mannose-1-phosphate guanylyltransferase